MKKLFLIIILFAGFGNAEADILIGARTGYYFTEPLLINTEKSTIENDKVIQGLMYGPVLKYFFSPDFAFTLYGIAGQLSSHNYNDEEPSGSGLDSSGITNMDSLRLEGEAAIEYRFSNYFSINTGYCLTANQTERRTAERSTLTDATGNPIPGSGTYTETLHKTSEILHGGELGFGALFNIYGGLFFRTNINGEYSIGRIDMDGSEKYTYYASDGTLYSPYTEKISFKADAERWTASAQPGIIFNTGEYGPIFSFEFQYKIQETLITPEKKFTSYDRKKIIEQSYGIIAGITFRI